MPSSRQDYTNLHKKNKKNKHGQQDIFSGANSVSSFEETGGGFPEPSFNYFESRLVLFLLFLTIGAAIAALVFGILGHFKLGDVQSDTGMIKDEIDLLQNDTSLIIDNTFMIKDDINILKNDTILIIDNTFMIKNDTSLIINNTFMIKDDIETLINNTLLIINNTFMIKDDIELIINNTFMIKDDIVLIINNTEMLKDDTDEIKNITNKILTDVCDEDQPCFGLGLCSNSSTCPSINKTQGGELTKDCVFGQCLYRDINPTIRGTGLYCDIEYFNNACKALINLPENSEIIPCLKITSACTFNQPNGQIEMFTMQCSYFFKCTCGFISGF